MISSCFWVFLLTVMASKTVAALSQCKSGPSALIFLHGLGDTPAGWSMLEQMLPELKPRLKDLTYVFPPAPITQITINGGMQMPGWFDLYDWPIGVNSKDDKEGILSSVSQIEAEVAKLEKEGIPKSRIVLGGFSQGGAVALLAAYHTAKEPYAGCVVLSAWLKLADELKVAESVKSTPLFWGHGSYDDKVLFEQQAFGVNKLKEEGIEVAASNYPVGHSSHPDEIQSMAEFLDKILYGDD
jgi:lysophospholipase-2